MQTCAGKLLEVACLMLGSFGHDSRFISCHWNTFHCPTANEIARERDKGSVSMLYFININLEFPSQFFWIIFSLYALFDVQSQYAHFVPVWYWFVSINLQDLGCLVMLPMFGKLCCWLPFNHQHFLVFHCDWNLMSVDHFNEDEFHWWCRCSQNNGFMECKKSWNGSPYREDEGGTVPIIIFVTSFFYYVFGFLLWRRGWFWLTTEKWTEG